MNASEVLENAVFAGQILLESGAEIYRVEETIERIAKNCGMQQADAFVLPTGIMVSVSKDGQLTSKIVRVRKRSIDLDKIDKINALSREISRKQYSSQEIKAQLQAIHALKTYPFIVKLIAACIGASAFALLFKGNWIDMCFSFITGFVIYISKYFSDKYGINFFINTIISSFLGVFLSLNLSRFQGNADIIIISGLMLLVPGLVITNAIRDSVAQDLGAALSRLLETFLIAIAIALGAILALALAKMLGVFI